MWLAILIIGGGCAILAFGVLSVVSNERHVRLQQIEYDQRQAEEKAMRQAGERPHGPAEASPDGVEEPIPVR